MSASEKLGDLHRRLTEPYADEMQAGYELVNALPQLRVVVEAAERIKAVADAGEVLERPQWGRWWEPHDEMYAALAALDAALDEGVEG